MSITLGNKIGEGGCSEVYEIGNDRIIKLAKSNTSFEAARREYLNNCVVWEYKLPVPQPFEFVELFGRPGIIVERIHGETILERFFNQNKNVEANQTDIQTTASLLYEVHNKQYGGCELPSQRSIIKSNILSVNLLSSHEKEAVIALLDTLPSKQCLCHGDPNPGNIIIRDDGQAVLIDWMNASIGNPEADIAEYIIMIRYAVLPSHFPENVINMFDSIREDIINLFMDKYGELTGTTYNDIEPWISPIAARKLAADAISDVEKEKLVQVVRRSLEKRKKCE